MRIEANGLGFEVQVVGEGRPAVLLHGFPDSGRLWRYQVPALRDAGFRVIVPDLRGAGNSDKPAEVEAYAIPNLVGDVLGILDALDVERAHVVGHDWGAALAWSIAMFVPDRVDQLVAMSVGHPNAFRSAGYAQREKSWYMLLFLFEGVAERWLSDDDWANFRDHWRHPDAGGVIDLLERTGALTPGLNWYRANLPVESYVGPQPEFPSVTAPTLGIWSSRDIALVEEQMVGSRAFVDAPWHYERLDGIGHWLQLEAPDEVNALLLDFLER